MILRLLSGAIVGAAGLILIAGGVLYRDFAFVAAGVALIGPMLGFFIGENNAKRSTGNP